MSAPERYERLWGDREKKPDNRIHAQRDSDRVLYSSAFRRLQGVTQVVSAAEGTVFHNRLTHSLKVAQLARRLAEKLVRDNPDIDIDLDPEVCHAAALAHDLGHPPFGHIAEEELHRLAHEHEAADCFEGNAQSLRDVSRLARCDLAFEGLDLTRATLRAILKYPFGHEHDSPRLPGKKWDYYMDDADSFAFAIGLIGPGETAGEPEKLELNKLTDDHPRSLEAEIMDWADDIAYAVHDLEDFYRSGQLPLDRLQALDQERHRITSWVEDRWSRSTDPIKQGVGSPEIADALSLVPTFFGRELPYDNSTECRIRLRTFTSTLIGLFVEATSLDSSGILAIPPKSRRDVSVMKELVWHYVIEKPALASQQHGQVKIVRTLFEIFHEAADPAKPNVSPALLPAQTAEHLQTVSDSSPGQITRAVVDSICSLTEDQAIRLHARLTGVSLGSVIDQLL